MATAIVGGLLAVCVILAARQVKKKHLLRSCGGDCSSCMAGCGGRKQP